MYHGFFDEGCAEGLERYGSRWCETGSFERQLNYLQSRMHVISLEQLVEHYQEGVTLPRNAVVLTLDDGYASNYHLAYPLLKARNIPACIFVSAHFVQNREFLWPDRIEFSIWKTDQDQLEIVIDEKPHRFRFGDEQERVKSVEAIKCQVKDMNHEERMAVIGEIEEKTGQTLSVQDETPSLFEPLRWEEIGEMAKDSPISFGSHTIRHPNLTTCTDEQLRAELVDSKALIAQKTGKACSLFCYPGGVYDARVKRFTEEAGYDCGLAVEEKFETNGKADLFELKRIGVARDTGTNGFIRKLLR